MTNEQFTTYLRNKLDACRKDLNGDKLSPEQRKAAEQAEPLLVSSLKIMLHSPGQVARRYKRDYLRRLAKAGVEL